MVLLGHVPRLELTTRPLRSPVLLRALVIVRFFQPTSFCRSSAMQLDD
jgi:hypothetical protein